MSNLETKRLFDPRFDTATIKKFWMPWRFMGTSRFVVLTLCGIILMLTINSIQLSLHDRVPIVENSIVPVLHDGYVSLVIDRTKNSFCNTRPSRIAFQAFSYNGQSVPFIIPLDDTDNLWPYLGRQKVAFALIREKDIPPGDWKLLISYTQSCNWIDWFAGGRVVTSKPVVIIIPKLPATEGQVDQ